ncbi:DUF3824 domain-containing protein [Streptomyces sp. NPDC026206]|uniref:DUF3824 domain-containing protein n=1 Tax=Streptomyces sp. NPDC026206 TaxID=3157089 RepID=UPI0033E6E87D
MTTPPPNQHPYAPQGGNPYGQQPPAPYGQQPGPYGQQPPTAPYGQRPTAPYGQPGGFPGAPVPPPAPRRSVKKIIRNVVLPVLGLIVAGAAWIFGKSDDTQTLAVGQCLENTGSSYKPNIEKRDCTASNATHKVLKKVKGTSSAHTACENVEGTVAAVTWKERSDSFVLCLAKNK